MKGVSKNTKSIKEDCFSQGIDSFCRKILDCETVPTIFCAVERAMVVAPIANATRKKKKNSMQ